MNDTRLDCHRTRSLIERLVGGSVTDEDRHHAAGCPACGPVLARAQRFEAELERTARGLVVEELPKGILDPELARQLGGSWGTTRREQGLAGGAVLVAAVVLATALVLRPQGPVNPGSSGTMEPLSQEPPVATAAAPGPSKAAGPPLHATGELIVTLVGQMSFECVAGEALPTSGPDAGPAVRHSAVCTASDARRRYTMAYALGVSATGDIAGLTIKADITGEDTTQARAAVAIGMAKLTALAFIRDVDAIAAYDYVFESVPTLEVPTAAHSIEVNTVGVSLERLPQGTYVVELVLPDSD